MANCVVVLDPNVIPASDAVLNIVLARKVGASFEWVSLAPVYVDLSEYQRTADALTQMMSAGQVQTDEAIVTMAVDGSPFKYVVTVAVPEVPADEPQLSTASKDHWRDTYRRAFLRADEIGCKTMLCPFPTPSASGRSCSSQLMQTVLEEARQFFEQQHPQHLQRVSFGTTDESCRQLTGDQKSDVSAHEKQPTGGIDVASSYVPAAKSVQAASGQNAVKTTSGVAVDPSCQLAYDLLHKKHQHAYVIFKIAPDDKSIVVEKLGSKDAPYSDFFAALKESVGSRSDECRYATVDIELSIRREGAGRESTVKKVIFIQFCPDEAPVRRRMLYASSVRALKTTLGIETLMQIQASDLGDVDEWTVKLNLMAQLRT